MPECDRPPTDARDLVAPQTDARPAPAANPVARVFHSLILPELSRAAQAEGPAGAERRAIATSPATTSTRSASCSQRPTSPARWGSSTRPPRVASITTRLLLDLLPARPAGSACNGNATSAISRKSRWDEPSSSGAAAPRHERAVPDGAIADAGPRAARPLPGRTTQFRRHAARQHLSSRRMGAADPSGRHPRPAWARSRAIRVSTSSDCR